MFSLFLDEPGREMFGAELGRWIRAKWKQKRMEVSECVKKVNLKWLT